MAQDDGIDVVFHVAESDADHTYAGLQMLSVVCLEAGVDAKPMSVGSGIAAHRHGNPVPNRVGLRPICNEMRSQITLLQNPSTTSLRDAYLYYCTQYQLKPNSDIRATLSTEQGAYDLQSLKLDGNFVGNNGILPLVEVLRLSTKLQELSLPNNGIKNAGVEWICDMALSHPSLTCLDLSRNRITLGGGKVLHELVLKNSKIVSVDLSCTKIDSKLLERIMQRAAANAEQK
jgi:Ran GTPase-activating protein (RanGAP) involved in mRNA processing and transport|uniref:Uncharacterized protein n=1 Tax=Eutreptiella gymnastica TaxID=73025 RepID=A0A7S4LNC6_9EUGL|eukprot:CAMPEP_0174291012 /NCGR_PEP_ID=MMETSP0809-20121228/30799_1 /TAXON_ID=73025 ORGANISM="Eutreptiella gymnastica-like, Strain CCMP1594" /NCGR_SAMPLE_ID=MMETSP0809 /ASSEMBLY_ACC=CAM_ASM_000658 /LENGTH=230 /DNA_ID=CAMNT_0015390103 /DNA_START=81 /DNA_END=773 /DNA_ORIENTATION=-